jgi:tetratricopeptide (TPR) repeat protein
MADVPGALADALRDRYSIERELGRGGMATVYLARDLKHGRLVALKVLRPGLVTAVASERFLREVQIAARLAHPHILPLLDSGAANAWPYFTMPFAEGETLRARLVREKQLSFEDGLRIACEVADALQYAHAQGVVHRDIKPENILIEVGHAVVSDFGIARAVTAAASEQLTEAGLAIGTPAYMSPEQATAAAQVDGRSDIYSLGCVVYEMIAGHPPFLGDTAREVLARHAIDPVPPLRAARPGTPAQVEEAVARALAKAPADRFSTAGGFAHALRVADVAAAKGGGDTASRVTRRRLAFVAAVAAVTVALVAVSLDNLLLDRSLVARGVLRPRERVLVADFGSSAGDSALAGALSEALRVDLAASRVTTTVPPEYVQQVLRRMERDPGTRLSSPLAREVAMRDGIAAFVTGELTRAGADYVISVQLLDTKSGEALIALRESARDSTEILATLDDVSKGLRKHMGEALKEVRAARPLEQVTTRSLGALQKYSLALAARRRGDQKGAIALLREAVALDTAFAMAYRQLGELGGIWGRPSEELDAVSRAYYHRDHLTDRERYLTEASYYRNVLGDRDRAMTAYRTLLALHPDDETALRNLSLGYSEIRNYERAESLAQRAILVAPDEPGAYMTLMFAQVARGRFDRAEATLAAMGSRTGMEPFLLFGAGVLAAQRGDYDSATSLLRGLRQRTGESAEWRVRTSVFLGNVAAVQGQLVDAEEHLRAAVAVSEADGRPGEALFWKVGWAWIDLWHLGRGARSIEQVDAALQRQPLSRLEPPDRPYLWLAEFYAEAGRLRHARMLLEEFERATPPGERRMTEDRWHGVLGVIALAERRTGDAVIEFRLADRGPCALCAVGWLARAYDMAGEADSAIAFYERYVNMPSLDRLRFDNVRLARTYYRLAELHEEKGDSSTAAEYYGRFVRLWKDADPVLQARVTQAKCRLEALTRQAP